MAETEEAPAQPFEDLPDTPEDQVTVPGVVIEAAILADLERKAKVLDKQVEKQRAKVLAAFEGAPDQLRGVKLLSGDAVRRVWSSPRAKPIELTALIPALADWRDYVLTEVKVDMAKLRTDHRTIHDRLGKVSSKRGIRVTLAGQPEGEA